MPYLFLPGALAPACPIPHMSLLSPVHLQIVPLIQGALLDHSSPIVLPSLHFFFSCIVALPFGHFVCVALLSPTSLEAPGGWPCVRASLCLHLASHVWATVLGHSWCESLLQQVPPGTCSVSFTQLQKCSLFIHGENLRCKISTLGVFPCFYPPS